MKMKQIKIFRMGSLTNEEVYEKKINSWFEEMNDDPTFNLLDVKYDSTTYATNVLVIYEIESEKEKEKRYEFGKKMADIVNNGLVEAKIDPFGSVWEDE